MAVLLFLCLLCATLYLYYRQDQKIRRFTDHGIPYIGGSTGSWIAMLFKGEHFTDSIVRRYNQVKQVNQKLGIELEFGTPCFFVTDLNLIKDITTTHFDHFSYPRKFASKTSKDLIARMLFANGGTRWKGIRSKLSPIFTTGQIKRMYHVMDSASQKWIQHLKNQTGGGGVIDMEPGITMLTIDFIAKAGFGWDTQVFDSSVPTEFIKMANRVAPSTLRAILTLGVLSFCPTLTEFLPRITLLDFKVQEYFRGVIRNAVKGRKENPREKRNDFIELLMEARDGGSETFSTDDITAHCLSLFGSGFETVRNALLFTVYSLSVQPQVQERLFEELTGAVGKDGHGENFTPEIINDLQYMEQVIQEALRIYPVDPAISRTCIKDFLVPGTTTVIPKGTLILIPIYAIHHDPENFPNPKKFDPERFSAENRSKLRSCSHIPFGVGPRKCIGTRLALLEMKTTLAYLIWNFLLEPLNPQKTEIKFLNNCMTMQPETGGLRMRLKLRK